MNAPELRPPAADQASPLFANPALAMTCPDFVEALRESQLIDARRLDPLWKQFQAKTTGHQVDGRHFAQALINAKLLTLWQAETILKGDKGRFFLGSYRLLSYLGRGGMGIVYLADHVRMFRRVALKILPQEWVQDSEYLSRFYKESQTLAALDHPNVVRAYDLGCDDGIHFLVMEYVDGEDIERIVRRDGPLSPAKAAEYIRQATDGLTHAHEKGVIHRDIKPANLLVDRQGRIKILDLGLARWTQLGDSMMGSGQMLGTPDYMSPEQALNSSKVDGRADIYSLGCTFYFMLTGRRPFTGKTFAEVLLQHQLGSAVPIKDLRPNVPAQLAAICEKMMSKSPEERYATTAEARQALTDWLNRLSKPPVTIGIPVEERTDAEILVADDDEMIRRLLQHSLEKGGYSVTLAVDGDDAMKKMHPGVSVCLFDIDMPGANGIECLKFVHANFPATPVIIISAIREIQEAVAAMREGAFDYFTKPCKVSNVLARVEEAIRARMLKLQESSALRLAMERTSHSSSESDVRAFLNELPIQAVDTPPSHDGTTKHVKNFLQKLSDESGD